MFALFIILAQETPQLLENLRSDAVETRDAATSELKKRLATGGGDVELFKTLKKAHAGEDDLEVKKRLEQVLRPWSKGGIAWERDLGAPIDQIVDANDERIVLITRHKVAPHCYPCLLRLRAISAKTGEPKWESADVIGMNPAKGGVVEDRYICVGGMSELLCYDLADGKRAWTAKPPPNISEPVIDGARIFVGGNYGVAAFDVETGKEVWTVKGKGWFFLPMVFGDDLIVGSVNDGVWRLSKTDGAKRWSADVKASPAAIAGDRLVCRGVDGVSVLSLSDGKTAWTWTAKTGQSVDVFGVSGGCVIVQTCVGRMPSNPMQNSLDYGDFEMIALSLADGKKAWATPAADRAPTFELSGDFVRINDAWMKAADGSKAEAPPARAAPPRFAALGTSFEHDEPELGEAAKATTLRAIRLRDLDEK